jgi:uncharacterized DUF497 family protein
MYNDRVRFEWDPAKNRANIKNHKVSFEEAQTVFFDPLALVAEDPDHSKDEDRLLAIGHSSLQRLLLVVHCFRESDSVIRIISARRLTRSERKQYEDEI